MFQKHGRRCSCRLWRYYRKFIARRMERIFSGFLSLLFYKNGKVVFFSGHTHSGLIKKTGGSVIKINNVTYVSTPSITKPNIKNPLNDNNSVGTGYIVELSKGTVKIRGYDFLQQKWLSGFEWII